MIGRIIFGLILAVIGSAIVIRTEDIYSFFGPITWAESKMSTMGGSRFMYKLIGLIFVAVGFLAITNLHNRFLLAVIGRFFGLGS